VAISIRPVSSSEDYAAWRHVRLMAEPDERAPGEEELRAQAGAQHRYSLAELDGRLAGSGVAGQSDLAGAAFLMPRVLPGCRRRGIGSAMLRLLAEQAAGMGFGVASSNVEDAGAACFAERHGFREVDRQVEQVRVIGAELPPQAPEGVLIVTVSDRPELWRAAYGALAGQAFRDMATVSPVEVTLEQWERDWITDPDAVFLALAGDEVIGCAGLLPDPDHPARAEHALTAVRRDWRRRGVARALKRRTLAWAAGRGLTEVFTWTQRGNDGMRALNAQLGYVTRSESITMQAALPLMRRPGFEREGDRPSPAT
jgi:mycothiol synthase